MGILIRTCLYKSELQTKAPWARAVHNFKESRFVQQMSFLFYPSSTLHLFPLVCTGWWGSLDSMSSSVHWYLANREPQKDMRKRRRGKLFSPCFLMQGFLQADWVPLPSIALELNWLFFSKTLLLVLGAFSSCYFRLRHANSHYRPWSIASHHVVCLYLPTPLNLSTVLNPSWIVLIWVHHRLPDWHIQTIRATSNSSPFSLLPTSFYK